MDIVNFDALKAQDRIIDPSQVDLEEDYFIIGKYTNHYTTNSMKYTKYPVYAIKAGDVMGKTPAYKVYSALLTQTGTDAPVVTVLENTLGVNVDCWYNNVGNYYFESFGTFIEGKTAVLMGPLKGNTWGEVSQTFGTYPDQIFILTFRVNVDNTMPSSLEPQNDVLQNTFIEIRVYN